MTSHCGGQSHHRNSQALQVYSVHIFTGPGIFRAQGKQKSRGNCADSDITFLQTLGKMGSSVGLPSNSLQIYFDTASVAFSCNHPYHTDCCFFPRTGRSKAQTENFISEVHSIEQPPNRSFLPDTKPSATNSTPAAEADRLAKGC